MRTSAVVLGLLLAVFMIVQIRGCVVNNYELDIGYMSYWSLADKSSTLEAKREYLSKFAQALDSGYKAGDFAAYNATSLKTPDNSFARNLTAVKTLVHRLDDISKMDVTSFQYNTAIEQITKQEQGEASAMMTVFEGCYTLENRPYLWGWIGGLVFVFELLLAIIIIPFLWIEGD